MDQSGVEYADMKEANASDVLFVRFWLDALDAATKEEVDWRKEAGEIIEIYRGDSDEGQDEFNIVYSNYETLLPAIYNSTPSPDVRPRYSDKDPIGKTVADILGRSIAHSVDAYDFDAVMHSVLFDGVLPGRGVARVRYSPEINEETNKSYQSASCEYVPWQNFRRGPGRTWDDVPWVAFEHFLNRDELTKLSSALADKVQMDCKAGGRDDEDGDKEASDIFKRARVWEIWDRDRREVIFIATGHPFAPLRREADPYKLKGFYPIPRPVQPITTAGNLVPVTSYRAYKKLAEELNEVTRRIKMLVKQIRVRGGYAAGHDDLKAMSEADDGELVPLQGMDAMIDGGGIDKAVAWWPIEPAVKALAQLIAHREQIKQTIYEVTGISDIVRGASQASETATAQQIKQQWGSLRIQRMQTEVQRFVRDLFRLKAELISTYFEPESLAAITGIPMAPQAVIAQAQQALQAASQQQPGMPPMQVPPEAEELAKAAPVEQIMAVLRDDVMRSYRIDIESDSTIRADLTRNQKNMSEFLQGTAAFMQAVGPAVQQGQLPPDVAVEVFTAFARNFKLGKQAEDSLERMGEGARKAAKQPKQAKPDPEMVKAEKQMQIEAAKTQADQQARERDAALKEAQAERDAQAQQVKAANDLQIAREKMLGELEIAREKSVLDQNLKAELARNEFALKAEIARENARLAREHADVKHGMAFEAAEHKRALTESGVS